MTISARIVADSISPVGKRITTFVLTYPRMVHAEFMTHRLFSRNAASSRAIPAKRIRASVWEDPAMPVFWGANMKGMQANEELKGFRLFAAKGFWKLGMFAMLTLNWCMEKAGLHKQIANRVIEPWFNITVLVTSTEWDNFYALRDHKDAQPEIRELARVMLKAHNESKPKRLDYNEWHLPFVDEDLAAISMQTLDSLKHKNYEGWFEAAIESALKVSVARCSRVSYMNQEGKRSTLEEDFKQYERLVGNSPRHASPTEHQAQPMHDPYAQSGNFRGWYQYRKSIEGEYINNHPALEKKA